MVVIQVVIRRHVVIYAHFSMQSFHCNNKLFLRAWEGGGGGWGEGEKVDSGGGGKERTRKA